MILHNRLAGKSAVASVRSSNDFTGDRVSPHDPELKVPGHCRGQPGDFFMKTASGVRTLDREIITKQKKTMAAEGLDALIALSPENVTYTAGFVVPSQSLMRWRHAACVVTSDGRITMLVIDMEESTVREHGDIDDVRVYREFTEDPMDKLSDAIRDMKLERGKVGIEMEYIPGKDLATLKSKLPGMHFDSNLPEILKRYKKLAGLK